jgi:serine phosphatase RsbU (regulator of sigma subunit)
MGQTSCPVYAVSAQKRQLMQTTDIDSQLLDILKLADNNEKAGKLNALSYAVRYSNPSKSLEIANEGLKTSEKINDKVVLAIAKMHIAFSHFMLSSDFPILQNLTEAHIVIERTGKIPELAIVLNYLGNVYDSYGDFQKGLHYCQQSLKLSREHALTECEADSLSTMGIIYSRLCDFQNAIQSHLLSFDIRAKLDNKPAMASSLNLVARAYALSGDYSKSEDYYFKAIDLRKAINDGAIPWSYLGLASLYEKQKKYDKAIPFYQKSLDLNAKSRNKRSDLQCNLGIGKVLLATEELDKSIIFLNEALCIAKELNSKPLLYEIYEMLSLYYEKTGNEAEAFKSYKQFHKLKEEVLNAQLHNELKNQQVKFEVEKTQKEAEIYQLRNVELKNAFDKIAIKNNEILQSIRYAQNIQSALLPPRDLLNSILPEYFILYMPKDIVSGDFYYANKIGEKLFVAAVDCTGHGVPGAFMSMLGHTFLNEIISMAPQLSASEILERLRSMVIDSLRQDAENETSTKDGMDISFCIIDYQTKIIQYAGAFNSLIVIQNNELNEIKADRMPIGIYNGNTIPFTNHTIKFEVGMSLFLCSDGYSDQFGGPDFKKFMQKNLRDFLLEIHTLPMPKQQELLEKTITDWKGSIEQTDDILVMGLRFN